MQALRQTRKMSELADHIGGAKDRVWDVMQNRSLPPSAMSKKTMGFSVGFSAMVIVFCSVRIIKANSDENESDG
jgi:hypothetical protein